MLWYTLYIIYVMIYIMLWYMLWYTLCYDICYDIHRNLTDEVSSTYKKFQRLESKRKQEKDYNSIILSFLGMFTNGWLRYIVPSSLYKNFGSIYCIIFMYENKSKCLVDFMSNVNSFDDYDDDYDDDYVE